MRHVKLPLRHQSKRLVRVQTEENESRADRDIGHYFIIVRRGCRWRRVEERLRLVVVGRAKNRDASRPIRAGCGRRPHDWRATACIRSRRRREGCSDRCQRPEDACDVFGHWFQGLVLCAGLCVSCSYVLPRQYRCSTALKTDAPRYNPTTRLHDTPTLAVEHALAALAHVCLLVSYWPLALHAFAR